MTAVVEVEDLARVAVEFGLTVGELKSSASVRESVASTAGVVDPRQEQWRLVLERVDRANEGAAATHGGRKGPARCKACGQAVRWVTTEHGKAMSLDPLPRPMGNVILVNHGQSRLVAQVIGQHALPVVGRPAYQVHFVSCPVGDQFRRRRRERGQVTRDGEPADLPTCTACGYAMRPISDQPDATTHPSCEESP